jgi:CheY-like chemotaxis protein
MAAQPLPPRSSFPDSPTRPNPIRERVSPLELVREVFGSLEREARAHGVTLQLSLTNQSFGAVECDRQGLRTILGELLTMAIRGAGTDAINVTVGCAPWDPGRWTIDVATTGAGLAQTPSLPSRLVLARDLAEQLGGTLTPLSLGPGQGATIRLTVGSGPPGPVRPPLPGRTQTTSGDALGGLRILLAEDHPDIQIAVRRLLESSGASIVSAYDGEEARDRALAEPFDLILMDLRMPGLSGLQATRLLRREGCGTPIVALTADAATVHRAAAAVAGCDAVLGKPFSLDELIATIRTVRSGTAPRT